VSHFCGFVASSFATAPRPTTSDKGKHTNQTAIDWPSGAIEADLTCDTHNCLNDLDDKDQEESQIDQAKDNHYAIGYPTGRA
jgi:hypothetical protein